MIQEIEWTSAARRDLRHLDFNVQDRVRADVYRLAEAGTGDVKHLRGQENRWRLRVGDIRVLFTRDLTTNTLRILRVLPRDRAYRD